MSKRLASETSLSQEALVFPVPARDGDTTESTTTASRKVGQTWSFRGSKSRNKVSVGEPAEGSLQRNLPYGVDLPPFVYRTLLLWQARSSSHWLLAGQRLPKDPNS